jgi:phosphatidylinositol glycan class B
VPLDDSLAAPPPAPGRTLALWILLAALAAGAALRGWLALTDNGIAWPDEIYQSLEPAHRWVWGQGWVALEFRQGLRNWTLAALVTGLFELFRGLGLSRPELYVPAVKCVFAAVGVATAWAAARLAQRMGAEALCAAAAGVLWALAAPAIYFAPRGLSEPLSALPVTLGLSLALPSASTGRGRLLGASLLGLAVLLRLQNALLCLAVLMVWLARRRWRPVVQLLAVLAGWALLYGLIDRLTWGAWFHSAVAYWRYNWVEGRGALFGASPWTYYLSVLWSSMPGVSLVLAAGVVLGARRAPALAFVVLAFLAAHMAIPHKELRFILPVLPAAMALAGVGLQVASEFIGWRVPVGLALLAAVASAVRFHALTFGELGAYEGQRDPVSAYDDFGNVNRLLMVAGRRADLCGLKVEATHIAWTGGYTYFHRDAPMYSHLGPTRESGHFNYVLTAGFAVPPGSVVAREGPLVLARLFDGPCVPDRGYRPDLP